MPNTDGGTGTAALVSISLGACEIEYRDAGQLATAAHEHSRLEHDLFIARKYACRIPADTDTCDPAHAPVRP